MNGSKNSNTDARLRHAVAFEAVTGGMLVMKFGFNMIFIIMGALCFSGAIYIFCLPRKVL
jgi:uncharacterized membrane protein YgdD (TMEM256/DUF423 family)